MFTKRYTLNSQLLNTKLTHRQHQIPISMCNLYLSRYISYNTKTITMYLQPVNIPHQNDSNVKAYLKLNFSAHSNQLVIPIHKKGPNIDFSNYRPISVLPITSLILEQHVNLHLKAFLELNSLFNENKIAGSLFLDFSKALDLVDQSFDT